MCFYPKNALFWWYEFAYILGHEFPLSFVFVFVFVFVFMCVCLRELGGDWIYGFTDGWIDGLTDCRMD